MDSRSIRSDNGQAAPIGLRYKPTHKLSSGYSPLVMRSHILCVNAPPDCSLRRAPNDVWEFVSVLRDMSRGQNYFYTKYGINRKQRVAIDFADTRTMSFAFAVLLVGELSAVFKPYRYTQVHSFLYEKWKPEVRQLLNDIGFFDYFKNESLNDSGEGASPVKVLKVKRLRVYPTKKESVDSGDATKEFLQDVKIEESFDFEKTEGLAIAISEALINVQDHAYQFDTEQNEGKSEEKWLWILGAQEGEKIRIFVYDKGKGIPESMRSSQSWYEHLGDVLRTSGDSRLIREALKGKSSTKEENRGLGLPKILDSIKDMGQDMDASTRNSLARNSLRIFSGRSRVVYDGYDVHSKKLDFLFNGTLIEWVFDTSERV